MLTLQQIEDFLKQGLAVHMVSAKPKTAEEARDSAAAFCSGWGVAMTMNGYNFTQITMAVEAVIKDFVDCSDAGCPIHNPV